MEYEFNIDNSKEIKRSKEVKNSKIHKYTVIQPENSKESFISSTTPSGVVICASC